MTTVSLVRAGALADVRTGEVLQDQAIEITDGLVSSVSSWSQQKHGGMPHHDLREHLVTPGLFDLHTHLPGKLDHGSYQSFLSGSAAQDALWGVHHASNTLRAGFTTVRDVGSFRAFVDCDLRDAINVGIVEGPRMLCAGAYVTSSSGGGEITDLALDIDLPLEYRFGVADSVDEVRSAVRRIAHRGADLIKIITTGAVYATGTNPGAPECTEAEIAAAVDEARGYGMFVAAHAHGEEGALRAIRAGVRTIEHGTLLGDAAIQAMLDAGTYFVPTTYLLHWLEKPENRVGYPEDVEQKTEFVAESARRALRAAIEAGVKVAYGTDAIVFPHGLNARQLDEFVQSGMTPMQALQSATIVAAECVGREDLGVIEEGCAADLIAVRGTELNDMRAFEDVRSVIKAGALVV